ncbi:helix-turn-helix domain-containing protein [Bradyrhizobium sp. PMVTL-01]|uniref:helix-turn-helix domain-containing protein n=1 Tax=unclassified Bradyrhizobium TaxID=2631580 RepID=UPI003F70A62E
MPPRTVRRIREYVDAHIDQSISVKGLAEIASLSVCYFVRAFKKSVGITPHEYLMQRRVDLAMSLLSATEMPLAEIAAAAGFVDQSHCSRRFRRSVGMSPRDYRRMAS